MGNDEDKKKSGQPGSQDPAEEKVSGEHLSDDEFDWDDDFFNLDDDEEDDLDWDDMPELADILDDGAGSAAGHAEASDIEDAQVTEVEPLLPKSTQPSTTSKVPPTTDPAAHERDFFADLSEEVPVTDAIFNDAPKGASTAQTRSVAEVAEDADDYTFNEQAADLAPEIETYDDEVPLSMSDSIRHKAENVFGEDFVDSVAAWPLWMVAVAGVIVLTLIYKLYGVFEAPTVQPTGLRGAQTQFTSTVRPNNPPGPAQSASSPVAQPKVDLPAVPTPPKPVSPTPAQAPVPAPAASAASGSGPTNTPAADKNTAAISSAPVADQTQRPSASSAPAAPGQPNVQSILPPPVALPVPQKPAASAQSAAVALKQPNVSAVPNAATPKQAVSALTQGYEGLVKHAESVNKQYRSLAQRDQVLSEKLNKLESSIDELNNTISGLAKMRANQILAGPAPVAHAVDTRQVPQLGPVLPKPGALHRYLGSRKDAYPHHRHYRHRRSSTATVFVTPHYWVRSVVPGRAWLIDQNGTMITVSKGVRVRGYGLVTTIDSEQGLVATSSGVIFRHGTPGH